MASSPRQHQCNPSSDSMVLYLSTSAGNGGGACDKDQEEGHAIRSSGRGSRNITLLHMYMFIHAHVYIHTHHRGHAQWDRCFPSPKWDINLLRFTGGWPLPLVTTGAAYAQK